MAGSQGVWELQFREKVIKIPEKYALKISRLQASEFTGRLSEFDRSLYIVSILYCMNKNPSDNLYQVYDQDFVLFLDAV